MGEPLNDFVSELSCACGENLVSVVLYGSAAREAAPSPGSDKNLIVVLKKADLNLLPVLMKTIRRARGRHNIAAVFWSEAEISRAADVFPVEFLDIKEGCRVLHGQDLFSGISIDTRNLRHQLEFELRSKLLRLRSEWPDLQGSRGLLSRFLGQAGGSLMHLFRHAQKISGGKLDESLAAPFQICLRLKRGEIRPGTKELEALYQEVHDALGRIVSIIDTL